MTDTISEGLGNILTTMSFGSHPTHTYLLDHIAWPAATKDAAISNIIKHEYPNSSSRPFNSIRRRALMRFLCLIVVGILSAANAQNTASQSFVLNEAKPYVYIAFDHAGNRKPLGPGESTRGFWSKFVNNCRVPITVGTFETGTGDPGIGVFHDVVSYESSRVKGYPGPKRKLH